MDNKEWEGMGRLLTSVPRQKDCGGGGCLCRRK